VRLATFALVFLFVWKGMDVVSKGLTRAFFGGGAGDRSLYMKLPLDLPRFHWKFADEAAVLAGSLELEMAGPDGRDTVLTVFRDGEMQPGWRAIETDRGEGELYFGFIFDGQVPTHPRDSVIVRLEAVEDLAGKGRWHTAVLPEGTYRTVASYSTLTGHPTLASLVPGTDDDGPRAYVGCWRELWPLRISKPSGWAGTPDDREERWYGGGPDFLSRISPEERGEDGAVCVEPGAPGS
jgi:hypothetical protein